ncbi:MAG: hypothetical protein KC800_16220 [Candidatus Eremiobacteraeota bacterium]|nr:hypothetical protein [Candidatus Eremiobacteraeota bacterium]
MNRLLYVLITAFLLFTPCFADEGYIRLVRGADGKPTELQTAIARFAAKNGTTVDLVGVIHVGDQVYYQKLDKHFNNYQSVLYEMILDVPKSVSHQNDVRELLGRERKEPRVDTTKGGRDSLSLFQQKLADVLGLEFQLPNIDYTRQNFHHADLTLQEFDKAMAGKKQSPLELLKSLFEVGNFEGPPEYEQLADLPLLRIIAQGPTPQEQRTLKIGMGALLAESDVLSAELENEVVIGQRNERALEVLQERMERGEIQFAVFYGAAHMADFSERLRTMGFKPVSKNWVRAWKF